MAVQADPATRARAADKPLPLENGDRLTREEFERRYAARPDLKKAELIEGVVYMPSPVRSASHAEPHAAILGWLVTYCAATPGVRAADNATVRLDLDNEPQPDALLRIVPAAAGRARMSADDYLDGAPELIVEIAASSAAIDLHDKLRAYRRNGVQEYVVWRVLEQQVDWFELSGGEYRRLTANSAGIMESRVFPGLRLAVDALLQGDLARVLAELQNGLSTSEHARFVEALRAAVHTTTEARFERSTGLMWIPLSARFPTTGSAPPQAIRFPESNDVRVRNWRDIPLQTALWLSKQGILRSDNCEFAVGTTRGFFSPRGVHLNGTPFHSPVPVGNTGIQMEGSNNPDRLVSYTCQLLERFNIDPSLVQIQQILSSF